MKPWVAAVVGTVLSFAAFGLVWQAERRWEKTEFRSHVSKFENVLKGHRDGVRDILQTLRAVVRFAPELTTNEFHESISGLSIRSGGAVQAFLWAPWVKDTERDAMEAQARASDSPGFHIMEGDITHPQTDAPSVAARREAYLPVRFLEPMEKNEWILGYDLLSDEPFATFLLQARDSGELTVSVPVDVPYGGEVVSGFFVALPVYRSAANPDSREKRRADFRGCVLAGFKFTEAMDWIAKRANESELDIVLVERPKTGEEVVLYSRSATAVNKPSRPVSLASMKRSAFVEREAGVPGQPWRLYFRRGSTWGQPMRLLSPLSILLAGIVVTAMWWRHWVAVDRRAAEVEVLVAERTAALGAANTRLIEGVRERRRAERSLEAERNLLRTLLDSLPDAVFVCDLEGRYQVVNAAHGRLLGLGESGAALGRPVREVGPAPLATAFAGRALASEPSPTVERVVFQDLPVTWEDGRVRHFSVCHLPLRSPEGSVDRVLLLAREVTEEREAAAKRLGLERNLQETAKLESLGLLAGGIAHDFNNLLTTIMGNLGLARMDLPIDSPVLGQVDQIEAIARRAADLCRQLLAYSGRGRFSIGKLDVNLLIRETNELIRLSVSKKAVVRLDLAADLPMVSGDATQLRQVLMNLVINGAEAIGDRPGEVRLRTSLFSASRAFLSECLLGGELEAGDYVCVEVTDDGSGMAPETLARIFDPFFTTKFLGRGLGLAAVLGITRSHHGAIRVESVPGRGTSFRLLLPQAGERVPEMPGVHAVASHLKGSGTLLVVDDEETVRLIAARILQRVGFNVIQATDGQDGVERFSESPERYRAVVLDLTMPRLDGAEALREIRRIRSETPVLLMSGFTPEDAGRRFADLGLQGFLQKPFGTEELLAAVEQLLAKSPAPTA